MELFLKFLAISFGMIWTVTMSVITMKYYHAERVKNMNRDLDESDHKSPTEVSLHARDITEAVVLSGLSGFMWILAGYAAVVLWYHPI